MSATASRHLRVDVSNAGLLAVGGMVAAILLSVGMLIGVAARNRPPNLIDIN